LPKQVPGKRYAQAIFELAGQQDLIDQCQSDLAMISQVLQDGEFRSFLGHAKVSMSDKVRSIEVVFPEANSIIRNVLALLISRGSIELVSDVHVGYCQLVDEFRGRQAVKVISAVALDSKEQQRISEFVSKLIQKEVVITTRVDESILGGVIIQVGDQLLDGSLRSKLEGLRREIKSDVAKSPN
jgi:F-type H+-transporting ATPase subunit delta